MVVIKDKKPQQKLFFYEKKCKKHYYLTRLLAIYVRYSSLSPK
jgi:hypothetical protein